MEGGAKIEAIGFHDIHAREKLRLAEQDAASQKENLHLSPVYEKVHLTQITTGRGRPDVYGAKRRPTDARIESCLHFFKKQIFGRLVR